MTSMVIFLNVLGIVIWGVAGVLVLTNKHGVSKFNYALCWGLLMFQLVMNCFGV